MTSDLKPPSFEDFISWFAVEAKIKNNIQRYMDASLPAARAARDAFLSSAGRADARRLEPLQLMAAADNDTDVRPTEITTPGGFNLKFQYSEGRDGGASLDVLVQCPEGMNERYEGRTAYLWIGHTRFELGQFDSKGGAFGTLPAGVEPTRADFDRGAVILDAPNGAEKS